MCDRFRSNFGRYRRQSTKPGENGENLDRHRSKPVQLRSTSADVGRFRPKCRRCRPTFTQCWPSFRPMFGQARFALGRALSILATFGSNSVEPQPNLADRQPMGKAPPHAFLRASGRVVAQHGVVPQGAYGNIKAPKGSELNWGPEAATLDKCTFCIKSGGLVLTAHERARARAASATQATRGSPALATTRAPPAPSATPFARGGARW